MLNLIEAFSGQPVERNEREEEVRNERKKTKVILRLLSFLTPLVSHLRLIADSQLPIE
jgi:hypothetical protein